MNTLNKMPSIGQFRNTVKGIINYAEYNNYPIPKLNITGTCKLHGTNSGISYHKGEVYFQSKNRVITPENDNAGFAAWCSDRLDIMRDLVSNIARHYMIDTENDILTIFGEFVGKGIQSGTAISKIEKTFIIFGIKIGLSNLSNRHIYNIEHYNTHRIYHINQFKTYSIEVDFNEPSLFVNTLADIVDEIEKECPVGKYFGVSGIGEGVVFSFNYRDRNFMFKCKGNKHTKIKKIKVIDDRKLKELTKLADKITPNWRLEQMYQETFDTINGGRGDIKKTGDYIRNVIGDINKEDYDLILVSGLKKSDVYKRVSRIARDWLMQMLDIEVGL